MSSDWPGNVRELENFAARSIALGSGPVLRDEVSLLDAERIEDRVIVEKNIQRLDIIERCSIMRALKENKGDKLAAARVL